jgi:hypothetical protein
MRPEPCAYIQHKRHVPNFLCRGMRDPCTCCGFESVDNLASRWTLLRNVMPACGYETPYIITQSGAETIGFCGTSRPPAIYNFHHDAIVNQNVIKWYVPGKDL